MDEIGITEITVSQTDIDEGVKQSICNCPIALACKRVFPNRTPKIYSFIALYGGMTVLRYSLPSEAIDFINNFDAGKPVSPATFAIGLCSIQEVQNENTRNV